MSVIRIVSTTEEDLDVSLRQPGCFPVVLGSGLDTVPRTPIVLGAGRARRHVLVADGYDPLSGMVRRYAALQGRPFFSQAGLIRAGRSMSPKSVTMLIPPNVDNFPEWWRQQVIALEQSFGPDFPLGLLAAGDVARLSRLLVKQLLQIADSRPPSRSLLLRAIEDQGDPDAKRQARINRSVTPEIVLEHRGPVMLFAHSRPHCGMATIAGKTVAVCSSPFEGREGRCTTSAPCACPELARIPLRRLATTRLFFQGCSTATMGTHGAGWSDDAHHTTAALDSSVREYIGNVTIPFATDNEMDWFAGLSAAGYSPAEAVAVLNRFRVETARECQPTLAYFGDASNRSWVPDTASRNGHPRIVRPLPRESRPLASWSLHGAFRRAALSSRLSLAGKRRIGDAGGAAVIHAKRRDAVMLFARFDKPPAAVASVVSLKPALTSCQTQLGTRIRRSLTELVALARVPAFSELLADAQRVLGDTLVTLEQASDHLIADGLRVDVPPELLALERDAAAAYDSELVRIAWQRSAQPWQFDVEFGPYRAHTPVASRCPRCRGSAALLCKRTVGLVSVPRLHLNCPRCFIVYDAPAWPLHVEAMAGVERRGRRVGDLFRVSNSGDEARSVTLALGIDVTARAHARPAIATIECGPRSHVDVPLHCSTRETPDNFRRNKLFVASEGAFGYFTFVKFL